MNAKKTLARLGREYKAVMSQLREESSPRKFRLVPAKLAGETDEYYYAVIYPEYERFNNAQQAKVDELNRKAWDVYARMMQIKHMNFVKRLFIA